MDRTDLGIFSHLVTDALSSDEAIGRIVGLTGKAVRARRQRLEAAGVLAEYGIHPAPELLGRRAVTSRFAANRDGGLDRTRLAGVEDLAYVLSFRPALHVAVRFVESRGRREDPRLARLLGTPIGDAPEEHPATASVDPDALSRADWRVLEAVVGDPRGTYRAKAQVAQVSARTARLHQAELERTGALRCVMLLNLEREAGLATYGVWLKVDDRFDERNLELPRLWDRPHWTQSPRGVYLLGSADNYYAAREMELRLRSLPGVTGADPMIPAGGYFPRERFLRWIREERGRRFPQRTRGA